MVWFFPFALRVLYYNMGWMNEKNAVRDLHRYVIHRLGDGALIVLGEGVLQVIFLSANVEFPVLKINLRPPRLSAYSSATICNERAIFYSYACFVHHDHDEDTVL